MRRKNAKIRIGPDYQADIPDLLVRPTHPTRESPDKAIKLWGPTENISETKLNEFLLLSNEKYGYKREQAMGMLFWHNYDLEKAIRDLPNFLPAPDDWAPEDTVTFESAISQCGKDFARIKQMMPGKSTATLVNQYYLRKHMIKKKSEVIEQVLKPSSSAEVGNEVPDKSIAAVTKYFYLWKRKTYKRKREMFYNKLKISGRT